MIPAYNEENRIKPTLMRLGQYFTTSKIVTEIIVVVNNSTDKTIDVVNSVSQKYPFISGIEIKKYTGKGGAIARGVKLGKGKFIAYQDADGSSSVKDLIKGYRLLTRNPQLDLVMGSRYIKGAEISGEMPIFRLIVSRLFNITVRTLFGLKYADTQCAVKVMKRHVAKKLLKILTANKWTVDVNMLIDSKFNKFEVAEFPIKWVFKSESKLNVAKAFTGVVDELLRLKIYQIIRELTEIGNKFAEFKIFSK